MKNLFLSDGTKTSNPSKILKEQSNFYKRLYMTDDNVEFNVSGEGITKLNDIE